MLESNNKNNVLDAEDNNGPRFTTILAARGEDGRPSGMYLPHIVCTCVCVTHLPCLFIIDLEFLLRSHCRNPIRVVERLGTQAAHLLLPKVAGTTRSLAIRLIEDVNTESEQQLMTIFCQNFQLCLILFVLPFPTQKAQLDDPNSLFHFAQRLARKDQQESKKSHGVSSSVSVNSIMLAGRHTAILVFRPSMVGFCLLLFDEPLIALWIVAYTLL